MPRFSDFDALSERLKDWHLEATQLDRGVFSGDLDQYTSSSALITEARFGRMLHQRGEAPSNLCTIAIPGNALQRIRWRGHTVCEDELMVFPADGELDAVSLGNFHVFTVSLRENTLQETALELTGADWEALLDRRETVRCTADRMERLRGLARVCVRLSHENRPHQESGQRMDSSDHEAEIANLLVEIASAAASPPTRPQARARDTIIRRSLEYIRAREDEPPSISDLCASVGASRRAVEYAFREHFGASPNAYILALRLESVRGELKISDREASITHAANRWGFHHLSHFAALYKRQFGELPSETRRALPARGAPPEGAPGSYLS